MRKSHLGLLPGLGYCGFVGSNQESPPLFFFLAPMVLYVVGIKLERVSFFPQKIKKSKGKQTTAYPSFDICISHKLTPKKLHSLVLPLGKGHMNEPHAESCSFIHTTHVKAKILHNVVTTTYSRPGLSK